MFKKLMHGVATVEKFLLAITMTVCLAFTFANVIGRFVFNHSLAFADELVIALFVLVSLMGAALCAREDEGLIGLALLSSRLTGRKKSIQKIFSSLISIFYCGVLSWQGFVRTFSSMVQGEHTFVMHLPRWIFWSFIPLCGICLILHFIENLVNFLKSESGEEAKK
ncbi:MAG: TRAP transporter small permease [Treponema sp.]|nr:TRAP transporter small permease [Treponema sp.]